MNNVTYFLSCIKDEIFLRIRKGNYDSLYDVGASTDLSVRRMCLTSLSCCLIVIVIVCNSFLV